ncbi:flagellar hook-associated protein FlgK [Sulfitobacter sp. M368]|uniref:flagellar hook-associated protein FlgK n=1 Tax=Sulfitobacter sp. M368 TaxID=2867021 RepID=UPI0021A4C520|nr:flagellar hook-associated protein FlgK [Sulfitobacter sp. M368]UWR15250.1 flagellar hook-associated protein FlgK [Sulfitobacter sp. M368]
MTISGALNNAMTGLRAAGRGAEVISSNISNALTPGYGRRVLSLSSSNVGDFGGVQINGITRIVDAGLAADRRLAHAENGNTQIAADFLARIENLLGTPDNPTSLTAQLSGFENSLITAASRPDAPERLGGAVAAARAVAQALNAASEGVQDARTRADRTIHAQVEELNTALTQIATLNSQITGLQVQGGDVSSLLDLRQQVVDRVGELVPVREAPRSNGQIALYSVGGAVLLDGTPAKIGFAPANLATPYMTLSGSTLSALTINGTEVRTDSEKGAIRGGLLAAQFEIRDETGVAAQTQIDALARDLIERFQDPAVDGTLAPGDAGLFTDGTGAFDPLDEVGISDRIAINAAVDPDQGGAIWRMRDGIGAVTQGDVGNASLLQALGTALTDPRVPASGGFGGGAFSAIHLATTLTSEIAVSRNITEQKLTYSAARLAELTERQLADGVDSDDEIQRLMLVEQAYAANARVIETVDEMLQTIMRL